METRSAIRRLTDEELRERFARAVRRGDPYWLWPELSVSEWQKALEELERVVRQVLVSGRADEPLLGDAHAVGIAAYSSGLGPLLGHWLAAGLVSAPPATAELLKVHHESNALRMERLAARAVEAVGMLTAAGIEVTVLKGMDTAITCFPARGTRPTSDVDLMIDPRDRLVAESVLRAAGYRPKGETKLPDQQVWRHASSSDRPQTLACEHPDDPWAIDLHTSANRRYAAGAPIVRFDDLIRLTKPDRWQLHPAASVLAPAASILFLACHAGCGLGNLRMVRLVELVLAVRTAERQGRLDWREVAELGLRSETLPSAWPALQLTEALAPGTIPPDVLARGKALAPVAVAKVVERLSPATCQRITHCPAEERFMWTTSLSGKIRQFASQFVPADQPLHELAAIYRIRFWKALNGHV